MTVEQDSLNPLKKVLPKIAKISPILSPKTATQEDIQTLAEQLSKLTPTQREELARLL
jgi:hypothetical protein